MKWQRFAIYDYALFENNGDYLQLLAFSCSLRCTLFESNFFLRCEVVFPIRLARWMHTVYLKLFFLPRSKVARNIYVVYGVGPVSESHKKVNYFFKKGEDAICPIWVSEIDEVCLKTLLNEDGWRITRELAEKLSCGDVAISNW